MSKRRSRGSSSKFDRLSIQTSQLDIIPITSAQRPKKSWTKHDIKNIKALTPSQTEMIHEYIAGQNILAIGSAGVAKTFLALYLALSDLLEFNSEFDKIIIVRSAVPSRDIGFMPGTLEEKTAFYEAPYEDICEDLLGRKSSYQDLKAAGKIQFITTSFVRGLTFDNAIIVLDECQNATDMEIHSVLTRVGQNSRIIICGDGKQDDLHGKRNTDRSGFETLVRVCQEISSISTITFTEHDIVRSGFVKEWIITRQRLCA